MSSTEQDKKLCGGRKACRMTEERVPADYTGIDLVVAKRFDEKVRENFMPAIISTVKHLKKFIEY